MSDQNAVDTLNALNESVLAEDLLTEEQLMERVESIDSILSSYGFKLESETIEGYAAGLQEILENYEFEADDQAALEEGFGDFARSVAGGLGSAVSRVRQGYQKGMQAAGAVSGGINRVKAQVQNKVQRAKDAVGSVTGAFTGNLNKHVQKDAQGNTASGGQMYRTQRGISSVGGNAADAGAAHAAVTAKAKEAGINLSGAEMARGMAHHQVAQDQASSDFYSAQAKDAKAKANAEERAKRNADMLAQKQARAKAKKDREDLIKGRNIPAKPSNSPLNNLPPPTGKQQTPSGASLARA